LKRRAGGTLLAVAVLLVLTAIVVNGAISNAVQLANTGEDAVRTEALVPGLAWIGAAGLLLIIALAIASWLTTGQFGFQRFGSITSLARSFAGFEGLSSKQRRIALSLTVPSFMLLDIGLGVAIWSITRANIEVWTSAQELPVLLATVAAELVLLVGTATFIWIQITYFKTLRTRNRTTGSRSRP
jgi:hypothetical protein